MLDFLTDAGDDNSNTSDKSFKFDKLYQKEFEGEQKCNEVIMRIFKNDDKDSVPKNDDKGDSTTSSTRDDKLHISDTDNNGGN